MLHVYMYIACWIIDVHVYVCVYMFYYKAWKKPGIAIT